MAVIAEVAEDCSYSMSFSMFVAGKQGTLPEALFELGLLKTFKIAFNWISGTLPSSFGSD
jgi:hypothetical protein